MNNCGWFEGTNRGPKPKCTMSEGPAERPRKKCTSALTSTTPIREDPQRELCGMQRRVGRHRKLEATIAAGALIETRTRTPLAHIAPGDCNRALVTTGRANSSGRPHHAFQQSPTLLLIAKGHDHIFRGPNVNVGKRCKHLRHSHLHRIMPEEPHGSP